VKRVADSSSAPPTTVMRVTLTKNQLTRLADITGNLGLVFFASVVIPYTLEKGNPKIAFFGMTLSLLAWIASIILERKTK